MSISTATNCLNRCSTWIGHDHYGVGTYQKFFHNTAIIADPLDRATSTTGLTFGSPIVVRQYLFCFRAVRLSFFPQ
jgi:hypothetical protein